MESTGEYIPFDRVADVYEATRHIPASSIDHAVRLMVSAGGLRPGDTFLDAGVGTGRFARHLASAGLSVIGVDVSEPMLARVREHAAEPVRLVRADLRALPLQTSTCRAALLVHVLHLIADWHAVVAECRRVIGRGGSLFLGLEGGPQLRSRQVYHQLASERGLTRPPIGAPSLAAILDHLSSTGASVERIDGEEVRWVASERLDETTPVMRRNVYSHLWHIEPDVFAEIADEAERRLRAEFGTLAATETAVRSLSLLRATWPGGRS